tara:strand:- start:277 stop:450 length:174 start_codon:yes stop_codon:yes gene_type:complete
VKLKNRLISITYNKARKVMIYLSKERRILLRGWNEIAGKVFDPFFTTKMKMRERDLV